MKVSLNTKGYTFELFYPRAPNIYSKIDVTLNRGAFPKDQIFTLGMSMT